MGSSGFRLAAEQTYLEGEVILEVGADRDEGSTPWLASLGPPVVTVDVDPAACERVRGNPRIRVLEGLAEDMLHAWAHGPIRFAWLDGHDWPYEGPQYPPGCWDEQERQYRARGQDYSQEASRASHLRIAELIASYVALGGVVAFDDTWRTDTGWDGKGGTAVPYLLGRDYRLLRSGDELVSLRRFP
jgi:hypothetical protein